MMITGVVFLVTGTYALLAQSTLRKGAIQGVGTVRYLSFEGGFWGIVSDDGARYDVSSTIPPEFQVDGLRVRFSVNLAYDVAPYHMWGQGADLVSIEKL
jgi:hypothetical protein